MDIKSMIPRRQRKALSERDPFAALQQEMNALFDDFLPDVDEGAGPLSAFMPRLDVKETDGEIRVTAELPGIDEQDVELSVDAESLTIKGEKKEEKEEKGEERYRLERRYGSFRRSVALPCAVDADRASATYKKGVLTVSLPKVAGAKKKTIAVKSS